MTITELAVRKGQAIRQAVPPPGGGIMIIELAVRPGQAKLLNRKALLRQDWQWDGPAHPAAATRRRHAAVRVIGVAFTVISFIITNQVWASVTLFVVLPVLRRAGKSGSRHVR